MNKLRFFPTPERGRIRIMCMASLTLMQEQVKDMDHDIKALGDEVVKAAGNKDFPIDQLTAKQDELAQLRTRRDAIKNALEEAERQEKKKAAATPPELPKVDTSAFKSMGEFFSLVADVGNGATPDNRLTRVVNDASGQNIGTDAEGGYLVPPEYADGLLKLATTRSVLYPKAQHIQLNSNRLIVNKLIDENRIDGNRGGGIQAFWTGEAAKYTPSKALFEQDQTDLHKLTGLCYATEEMLQDYPAMASFLSEEFGDEFSFKIDDALLNGTGTGMPTGILNAANTALVTVPKESGQAAGTVLLQNLMKMYNAMPSRNRANAEWYINQDIEMLLMQLFLTHQASDGETTTFLGVPVYLPAGGISAAPYGSLFGRPLVPVEQCSAVGSLGDIVFADMSQYRVIEKAGMRADTSVHVRFEYGEQAFRFMVRMGGKSKWIRPITPYKGTTARSPFVALATRA